MNRLCFKWLVAGTLLFIPTLAPSQNSSADPIRERRFADANWKFHLGDISAAETPEFDDSNWRTVNLPHDWSVEGEFDPKSSTGGAEGFLPQGTGWYRRTFKVPDNWRGKQVSVEFEGVYMNAHVWLNGKELGFHPYGYTGFSFDLTPGLNHGKNNVLAVRVDSSKQKNSRWYSGSGIYRHVWITVTDPVHVSPWGVFVRTTELAGGKAKVAVDAEIANDGIGEAPVTTTITLMGPGDKQIGAASAEENIASGKMATMSREIEVTNPPLWSPELPQMSSAIVRVLVRKKLVDEVRVPFGIRSLAWSTGKGLQLNGKTIQLCGGCIHQDNGCLGSAAFDRAEERKIEILKAAGFNVLRMAHNPPSSGLLDACDRLGMLVMDEAFDCWEKGKNAADYSTVFQEWWQRDIDAMVKRDRNHPAIVFWSIGNEIPEQYDSRGTDIGTQLAGRIHSLDQSRPVTQAFNSRPKASQTPGWDRLCSALDIIGYNYTIENGLREDHPRLPARIMVCTETYPSEPFKIWSLTKEHSFILGDFVWTALDYEGENGIGRWQFGGQPKDTLHGKEDLFPWHGAYCGNVDSTGVRKPSAYYRNIVWDHGEKLYIAVQHPLEQGQTIWVQRWGVYPCYHSWTWPGFENKQVKVEVYSRYEAVRLYQDGKLIGEKPTGEKEQFKAVFDVTYAPGTLKVVGLTGGKPVAEQTLSTAGTPATLRLKADRSAIQADGQDLAFVTVEVLDKNGNLIPNVAPEIEFRVEGPGSLAGLGNGDMTDLERYQATKRKPFEGRALAVIRSTLQSGQITLKVRADRLPEATMTIKAEAASGRATGCLLN
ncbi:MAG: sugar-binding domain-containing protein [Verrucomicrobiota bacterium]